MNKTKSNCEYHTTNYLPWIVSLELFLTRIINLYAHPQVDYCNFESFISINSSVKEGLCIPDIWTDGQSGWFLYTPKKTWFVCRDLTNKPNLCMTMRRGIKFVRIIGVFEFTRVTCRPLLTFWVQVKLDSIN